MIHGRRDFMNRVNKLIHYFYVIDVDCGVHFIGSWAFLGSCDLHTV